jgi:hypothetical protein
MSPQFLIRSAILKLLHAQTHSDFHNRSAPLGWEHACEGCMH